MNVRKANEMNGKNYALAFAFAAAVVDDGAAFAFAAAVVDGGVAVEAEVGGASGWAALYWRNCERDDDISKPKLLMMLRASRMMDGRVSCLCALIGVPAACTAVTVMTVSFTTLSSSCNDEINGNDGDSTLTFLRKNSWQSMYDSTGTHA